MNKSYYLAVIFLCAIPQTWAQTPDLSKYKINQTGFFENKGQITDQNYKPNPQVKYLLCNPSINVQLRQSGFSYDTYADVYDSSANRHQSVPQQGNRFKTPLSFTRHCHRVDVDFLECNPATQIINEGESKAYFNYFNPGTPLGGVNHVHYYQKVTYKNIYPNIDFIATLTPSHQGTLNGGFEYFFAVHKGGKINDIKLKYTGANKVSLTDNKLVVNVTAGNFTENIPRSYLESSKQKVQIDYISYSDNTYGYTAVNMPSLEDGDVLIIDPIPNLEWATYYGGTDDDQGYAITLDANDNAYITGFTASTNAIATAGTFQTTYDINYDAFIAKFNPTGSTLVWGTYYGGNNDDQGYAITLDQSNNVYITGSSGSTNVIATAGAWQATNGGADDAFIAKFDPTGSSLLWGTYYGGNDYDYGYGIALDANNNVYITGNTASTNTSAIATAGAWQPSFGGIIDALVAKFNSTGTTLLWGTYYGGSGADFAYAIALDAAGNAYITGSAASAGSIATAGAWQTTNAGTNDAFIAKFNGSSSTLQWGTYYGGIGDDDGYGITLDPNNNIYVTGYTSSASGISTAGTWQSTYNSNYDIFIAKFNPGGSSLTWGTYYGGSGADYGFGIKLDAVNNIYITGTTSSTSAISTANAYQKTNKGSSDAVVAKFDPKGSSLIGSTYYGGTSIDQGLGIALDSIADVYIVGITESASMSTIGAWQTTYGSGVNDAFVARFDSTNVCPLASVTVSNTKDTTCSGDSLTISATATGSSTLKYIWSPGGQTTQTIHVKPTSNTTYKAFVSDTVGGCFQEKSVTIIVHPLPVVTLSGGTTLCKGDSTTLTAAGGISYTWSTGNTNTSIKVGPASTTTYSVSVYNGVCTKDTTVTVFIDAPLIPSLNSLTNDKCNGDSNGSVSVKLSGGTTPYTYSWNNGQTTSTATGLSAGTYTCTITDKIGCITKDSFAISQPLPITATNSTTIAKCGDSSGTGTVSASGGTGAFTYLWAPSGGANAAATKLSAGMYTVTITDANGCNYIDTVVVKTTPLPVDTICCSTTIDRGSSVTLRAVPASPGNTYSWTPSTALSCTNCPSAIASPTVTTTYYITITDSNGCSKLDSVVVAVRVCGSLYLPNVFSPNGDGYNDVLYVYGNCTQTMELMIFDRWGNKIFESTDPKTGWDGTYKGSPMNAGSYVYTLKVTDFDNNTTFKKGTITLMR